MQGRRAADDLAQLRSQSKRSCTSRARRFRRLGDLVAGTLVITEDRHVVGNQLRLEPPPYILRLGMGIKRLVVGLLQLFQQVRNAVMLGQLRRIRRSFFPNIFGFLVQVFFVHHLINLVRAWAVKSTMGTTRA